MVAGVEGDAGEDGSWIDFADVAGFGGAFDEHGGGSASEGDGMPRRDGGGPCPEGDLNCAVGHGPKSRVVAEYGK